MDIDKPELSSASYVQYTSFLTHKYTHRLNLTSHGGSALRTKAVPPTPFAIPEAIEPQPKMRPKPRPAYKKTQKVNAAAPDESEVVETPDTSLTGPVAPTKGGATKKAGTIKSSKFNRTFADATTPENATTSALVPSTQDAAAKATAAGVKAATVEVPLPKTKAAKPVATKTATSKASAEKAVPAKASTATAVPPKAVKATAAKVAPKEAVPQKTASATTKATASAASSKSAKTKAGAPKPAPTTATTTEAKHTGLSAVTKTAVETKAAAKTKVAAKTKTTAKTKATAKGKTAATTKTAAKGKAAASKSTSKRQNIPRDNSDDNEDRDGEDYELIVSDSEDEEGMTVVRPGGIESEDESAERDAALSSPVKGAAARLTNKVRLYSSHSPPHIELMQRAELNRNRRC